MTNRTLAYIVKKIRCWRPRPCTDTANVIGSDRLGYPYPHREWRQSVFPKIGGTLMKIWNKPQVTEQSVGLEVTSYMPAEVDII